MIYVLLRRGPCRGAFPRRADERRRRDEDGVTVTARGREGRTEGLITVACCNTCHYPQTDRPNKLPANNTRRLQQHTITCVIILLGALYRVFVIAIVGRGAISINLYKPHRICRSGGYARTFGVRETTVNRRRIEIDT